MKKKDKIAILYSIILCFLFIIRTNTHNLDACDDYIFMLLLYMSWDLLLRPRKYEITITYLQSCCLNDDVLIYCTYDSNQTIQDVYCKIVNNNILDGYRKLNPIIGFYKGLSLQSFKSVASEIKNVDDLLRFVISNYKIPRRGKEYDYYKSDTKLFTCMSFASMVLIDFMYLAINYRVFNDILYYYPF